MLVLKLLFLVMGSNVCTYKCVSGDKKMLVSNETDFKMHWCRGLA